MSKFQNTAYICLFLISISMYYQKNGFMETTGSNHYTILMKAMMME